MKTQNTNNNRTQKKWNNFAIAITTITFIIWIGGSIAIFTNL